MSRSKQSTSWIDTASDTTAYPLGSNAHLIYGSGASNALFNDSVDGAPSETGTSSSTAADKGTSESTEQQSSPDLNDATARNGREQPSSPNLAETFARHDRKELVSEFVRFFHPNAGPSSNAVIKRGKKYFQITDVDGQAWDLEIKPHVEPTYMEKSKNAVISLLATVSTAIGDLVTWITTTLKEYINNEDIKVIFTRFILSMCVTYVCYRLCRLQNNALVQLVDNRIAKSNATISQLNSTVVRLNLTNIGLTDDLRSCKQTVDNMEKAQRAASWLNGTAWSETMQSLGQNVNDKVKGWKMS